MVVRLLVLPIPEVCLIHPASDPRPPSRRRPVLPLLALLIVWLSVPTVATADETPAPTPTPVTLPGWTVQEAVAALLEDDVVVLPDALARIDENRVRALVDVEGEPAVKVLVVPPGPLDSDANRGYRSRIGEVEDLLGESWDGELVTVTGLEVGYSILIAAPSRLWTLRQVLSTLDPTEQIDGAIRHARTGSTGDDPVEPAPTPSDPAEVERVIAALRSDPLLVEPGAEPVQESAVQRWQEETGHGLRLVVAPALDPGEQQRVTAADLAPAFPEDHVVVFHGRWFELAGAEQDLLGVARDMTLSSYSSFLLGRDVGPANILGPLRTQVAEFTSGAVTGQQAPTQRNPVAWLLVALPVLALALVVWFALRRRRNRAQEVVISRHRGVADLAAAAALLPGLAEGILALDGLARDRAAKDLLTLAATRYRTARDLVRIGQDGPAALAAARQAQDALTEAARLLGVPHVPGTRTGEAR